MDRSFFQSSIILYEQQWILFTRVLISLKLNPDDDPDHQVWIRIKEPHHLCRLSAHFTVYNLSEIKIRIPPSASRACHSKFCQYKMKRPTFLKEDRSFLNKIMERILSAFVFFQSCLNKVSIINVVIKHHPAISTDTVLCFVKIESL